MSYLFDETDAPASQARVFAARIASNAVDMQDRVDVIVPNFDDNLRWQDVRWQARDNFSLPQRGMECVVVMDDNDEMSIVGWWPETTGGGFQQVRVETSESTMSSSYADLATVGPSVTVAEAGDYDIRWGFNVTNPNSGAANAQAVVLKNNATQANFGISAAFLGTSTINSIFTVSGEKVMTGLAEGDVLKLKYLSSNGIGVSFSQRFLSVQKVLL
jgi:hypothetical protein